VLGGGEVAAASSRQPVVVPFSAYDRGRSQPLSLAIVHPEEEHDVANFVVSGGHPGALQQSSTELVVDLDLVKGYPSSAADSNLSLVSKIRGDLHQAVRVLPVYQVLRQGRVSP
jgi:hypothetical protein